MAASLCLNTPVVERSAPWNGAQPGRSPGDSKGFARRQRRICGADLSTTNPKHPQKYEICLQNSHYDPVAYFRSPTNTCPHSGANRIQFTTSLEILSRNCIPSEALGYLVGRSEQPENITQSNCPYHALTFQIQLPTGNAPSVFGREINRPELCKFRLVEHSIADKFVPLGRRWFSDSLERSLRNNLAF